ncbi:centromere protein C-like [Phragmites australis]|uniref:centromere protein C-like n=1 Tax=Phragmites australis TaxID=29695 RepID=UPI002D78A818|nr:centromere protein C-like [Phragmites australis]
MDAAASATRLLPRTLGPAPAASPSKADEALLHALFRPLKGSRELVVQARMVMKEHGDIRTLYQDGGAKAVAAANGKNNQQGRRPALDRKRPRFTIKAPASKLVPEVDRSVLLKISDPDEYFATADRLDEAEKEIKRLKGEAQTEKTYNFEPVVEIKRRPDLLRRKSVHTFKFSAIADTRNTIEIPASQKGTMTESQLPQDELHASVSEKNEQSVPSHAISDVSAIEDLDAEKDSGDALTHVLTSFRNLDESKEEDFMRETLGLPEIRMENFGPRDSTLPGDRPLSSTVRKNSMRARTPEPGKHHARISELEKHISFIVATKDKCTDISKEDELEGSPDIVMGEQLLVPDSSDVVLMIDETFAAREIDGETPSPSAKLAEYDPEPNMPDRVTVDERQAGGSPLGLYRDTEVAKEKDPCSRHNISIEFALQEDDVPMDYPTIDKPSNETEVSSSHHLAGKSTEVLVSTPGRIVALDDIARTSHVTEDNNQHQAMVEEDGVVQDKSSHASEVPQDDIDPQNQSQADDGNIKKLAVDLQNALSPAKEKKQKTAQKGKKKQQSKRGEKVADESSHPLEIPQANFDSENQPDMRDVNIEQQTVGMSNALSPNKAKGPKEAQWRNKTKQFNRRKSLEDAGLAWQSGLRRSTRIRSRPLEQWLGERFVYGRIHDTMATVIGIKTCSPGQDGKKTLKVKSFVPEQYSDLVANSAKY